MQHTTDFLIRKDQLTTTTLRTTPAVALPEGQVRVAIHCFALTSNNITYAAFGDAMNYWQFFPVLANGAQWGRIPVWGFGSVVESRHTDVPVGERLYGYFPMSNTVDLTPARVSPISFVDAAPHRAELHPVYNQYSLEFLYPPGIAHGKRIPYVPTVEQVLLAEGKYTGKSKDVAFPCVDIHEQNFYGTHPEGVDSSHAEICH